MKKILKLFFLILILAFIFIGVWFSVNLWPRPLEPALWSETDIQMPEDKDQNAYNFLLTMRDDSNFSTLDIPDDLFEIFPKKFTEDSGERKNFWTEAKKQEVLLSAFLGQKSAALQGYQKLLDSPQFVDQDAPRARGNHAPWLTVADLHKIGSLYLVQLVLASDPAAALTQWLKMYRFDQAALATARTSLSHMVAVNALEQDLVNLSLLKDLRQPDGGTAILESLKDFDPQSINYRHALIFDYLVALNTAEIVAAKDGDSNLHNFWLGTAFNQSLFRRAVNDQYRRLETLLQNPSVISDAVVEQFDEEGKNLRSGAFWWFYNPGGKILQELTFVNPAGAMKEFYMRKEDIKKMRASLLKEPLFPSSPETH